MRLSELPVEEIRLDSMPFYHRQGAKNGNTYIRCGTVKPSGNGVNAYVEERACEGHICRVLMPEKTIDKALLIRDDGTNWIVRLSNFQEVRVLKVRECA